MVIDTSTLVAILIGEPSRESLLRAAAAARTRIVSAVSLLEAGMVLRARAGEAALPLLYEFIDGLACEVVAFDQPQARRAVYALATERHEPILAIGNDFPATGITVVPL